MLGIECESRNTDRPAGVAVCFQISKRLVEPHRDEPISVFSHDVGRSALVNDAAHIWPECTVIRNASALSGQTDRLTRKPAGDEIDGSESSKSVACESSDIVMLGYVWPVFEEDSPAPRVDLAEANGFDAEPIGSK